MLYNYVPFIKKNKIKLKSEVATDPAGLHGDDESIGGWHVVSYR